MLADSDRQEKKKVLLISCLCASSYQWPKHGRGSKKQATGWIVRENNRPLANNRKRAFWASLG